MDQAAIIRTMLEALRLEIEERPNLKVQPLGDLGLAVCNTPRSITVTARMSSDGQWIMLEHQQHDELTGILMKKPDTIEVGVAEDATTHFVHKGTQLDLKGLAQFLIEAVEGSSGV